MLLPIHHGSSFLCCLAQDFQQFPHLLVADGALGQRHTEADPVFLALLHQDPLCEMGAPAFSFVRPLPLTSFLCPMSQLYMT